MFIDCFLSNLSYVVIFMLRFIMLKVPNYFWITAGPHISEGVQNFNTYLEMFGLGTLIYQSIWTPWWSKYYSEVHGPGGPNTLKHLDWYLDRGTILGGSIFWWQHDRNFLTVLTITPILLGLLPALNIWDQLKSPPIKRRTPPQRKSNG